MRVYYYKEGGRVKEVVHGIAYVERSEEVKTKYTESRT